MTHSPTWRIGELATATGLTVRTLRHYEQLGLLSPTRTVGDHRLYDAEDVRRLYEIRALCGLGLTLREVARVLGRRAADLPALLVRERERVAADIARLSARQLLLEAAIAHPDSTTLLQIIADHRRVSAHGHRRRGNSDAEATWRAIGRDLRRCFDRGDSPAADETGAVARRAHVAIRAFAQGDEAVLEALTRIRRWSPPRDLLGWDPPLFAYLDRALRALEETC